MITSQGGSSTSFGTPFKACLCIKDAPIIIQYMFNVDATMMFEDELPSELNNDRENMININVNSILNYTICH
jgi:hypothetical protein